MDIVGEIVNLDIKPKELLGGVELLLLLGLDFNWFRGVEVVCC